MTSRVARALAALALAAAASATAAPSAPAATAREVRALASRATHDPAALARLRAVRSVDGRPVDLRAALRGARGAVLAARLRALASPPGTPARHGSAAARRDAAAILAQRRFSGHDLPHPLHRPLRWLGDRLAPVGRRLTDAFDWVAKRIPGGPSVLWSLIGLLVVMLAALSAIRLGRRRARAIDRAATARRGALPGRDVRVLEQEADRAERAGDFEGAVRLRFRAGLLRLDAARVLPFDPSLTSGAAARRVGLPAFDALATRFDEIAYGRFAASSADAAEARDGWRRVLREVGAR